MLGLGSSITTGGAMIAPSIKAPFTSDFTSDVDGWLAFSIQNSSSDLTLAATSSGVPCPSLKYKFGQMA